MVVKQMDDWSTLIGELEHNTPEKVWIVREELNISEVFEIQKLEAHFILVLEGVLRMENEHQQILHYFRENNVIYQSPYELRVQNKLRLVAETPAHIVLLHREFFFNYATNQPAYSEKLVRAIMDNAASFMFELMKNDLKSEDRLAYSLQQLCQSLELEVKMSFIYCLIILIRINWRFIVIFRGKVYTNTFKI